MRVSQILALLLLASSTGAIAASAVSYYGPMRSGQGYRDELTQDGYWKIQTATKGRRMLAIDAGLYRAAELARAAGGRFVEIHDAYSEESRMGDQRATLFARVATEAIHPRACRSGKANRCYTADVAVVMKRLSGASGKEPGMAAPSRVDQYGRTVFESGYGTGAVTPLVPTR